MLDLSII